MMEHWGFIAAAYAVTALAVAALVLRAIVDHRAQARALADLEARGVTRRSDRSISPVAETSPMSGARLS